MKNVYIIGGAAALGVGALAFKAWRNSQAAAKAAAPQAAPEVAGAQGVAPPAQQAAQEEQGGGLPKIPTELGTVATVVAGIKLQNAIGNLAERVGGEGAGNVARVAPAIVGLGVIAGNGVQAGLEHIGVANEP